MIKQGKLAVIIGIESSDLFNCSEFMDKPDCTEADVDRGITQYKQLGVRGMFIAHWVDNAFAGAALEGGAQGRRSSRILEALQTGEYFTTGPCPEPGQGEEVSTLGLPILRFLSQFFPDAKKVLGVPHARTTRPGKQCNAKGLTDLGHYLVRRMMANHMLIEVDHMSERARDRGHEDRRGPRLPARLEPHGHRRLLDEVRPPAAVRARGLCHGEARHADATRRHDPEVPP